MGSGGGTNTVTVHLIGSRMKHSKVYSEPWGRLSVHPQCPLTKSGGPSATGLEMPAQPGVSEGKGQSNKGGLSTPPQSLCKCRKPQTLGEAKLASHLPEGWRFNALLEIPGFPPLIPTLMLTNEDLQPATQSLETTPVGIQFLRPKSLAELRGGKRPLGPI